MTVSVSAQEQEDSSVAYHSEAEFRTLLVVHWTHTQVGLSIPVQNRDTSVVSCPSSTLVELTSHTIRLKYRLSVCLSIYFLTHVDPEEVS